MKHVLFISGWVCCSFLFFAIGFASLVFFEVFGEKTPELIVMENRAKITSAQPVAASSSNSAETQIQSGAEVADARILLVKNFLERYNSPLTPHDHFAQFFVELADTYEIDFRLIPAIAMQESNLCKVTPPDSYNCLGLGVHERGTWHFDSYEANFEAAAKILKKNYIDIGLTTPEQIMRKYTPGSNGSWAASVNQWMAEMRYDDRQLGRTEKTDADLLEFVEETPPLSE